MFLFSANHLVVCTKQTCYTTKQAQITKVTLKPPVAGKINILVDIKGGFCVKSKIDILICTS